MKSNRRIPALSVIIILGFGALFALLAERVHGQDTKSQLERIKWLQGPCVADIGTMAQIRVPANYIFANSDDTKILMELMQNPTSGHELGFLGQADTDWFVVFEFDEIGYVKDDEKASLDADAILKTIKNGTEKGNEERRKRGWPPLNIIGWETKPYYNPVTHNLEWAIRGESEGRPVVNHNTRLLGRKGVMRVTLVADPSNLRQILPDFRSVMSNFSFNEGNKYAEFRQGDKIAKYGLSALVVGGATAVAVKSGAFKWVWKALVAVFIALAAFLKRILGRKGTPEISHE